MEGQRSAMYISFVVQTQAGVSLPDYRDALVVKALEIEYNIFSVLNRFIDMNFENRRMAYEGKYEY